MAPKAAKDGTSVDAAVGNTTLSPKETEILLAVVSLMPEVPEVNFDEVAKIMSIKYAKNARAAVKKLFEKLRSQAPIGPASASAAGNAADEADEEEAEPAPATRASAKKGTAKKAPAKKGVGKTTAPKKAAAPKKPAKKVAAEEAEENGEEGTSETEDGKSPNSVVPTVVPSPSPIITTNRPSVEPESLPVVEPNPEPEHEMDMEMEKEPQPETEQETEVEQEPKRELETLQLSPEQKQSTYKSLFSRVATALKNADDTAPVAPIGQEPVAVPVLASEPVAPIPTLTMKVYGVDYQFTQWDIDSAEHYRMPLYDYLAWKMRQPYILE